MEPYLREHALRSRVFECVSIQCRAGRSPRPLSQSRIARKRRECLNICRVAAIPSPQHSQERSVLRVRSLRNMQDDQFAEHVG